MEKKDNNNLELYNKFGTTDKLISFGFNENNETINFHITF